MSYIQKLTSATLRTSGITDESVTAGANVLGSTIDNSENKDVLLDVEVTWTCGSAPTSGRTVDGYIIYAVDGVNFEDGDGSTDPTKVPDFYLTTKATTSTQKGVRTGIPIRPYPFKILLENSLGQTATISVAVYTSNLEVIEVT